MFGNPAFPGGEDGMMHIHDPMSGKRFSLAACLFQNGPACPWETSSSSLSLPPSPSVNVSQVTVCIDILYVQLISNRVASPVLC